MKDNRKSIRPFVATANTTISEAEAFQNETLRPVLKLQNDLLLAIFVDMLEKRKVKIAHLPPEQKITQIQHRLSKDNKLRYTLLGSIIGQFTLKEYQVYLSMEAEAKRRIFTMMGKRLVEQL